MTKTAAIHFWQTVLINGAMDTVQEWELRPVKEPKPYSGASQGVYTDKMWV